MLRLFCVLSSDHHRQSQYQSCIHTGPLSYRYCRQPAHRADITVIKTALTLAAFNGRKEVELEDVKNAAKLVLPHRMRRRPFEEGQLDWDKVESILSSGAKGAL